MVWERAGVGETPHPYFGVRESGEKGTWWRRSSIDRHTGMQHCCAGRAQSRQKYPKMRGISGYLIFLDDTQVGRASPPHFGAVETKEIGHSKQKASLPDLFNFRKPQLLKS